MTPGGGSAAAITAALGTALLEMTAGINQKKAFNRQFARHLKKIKKIRLELLTLAAEDAKAFLNFLKVRKKDKKSRVYQNALKKSARVPLKICALSCEALRAAQREIPRTGRWLASDLAEAAILLEAAFRAGRWNAEINLKSIQDRRCAEKGEACLAKLEKDCSRTKNKIIKDLGYGRRAAS